MNAFGSDLPPLVSQGGYPVYTLVIKLDKETDFGARVTLHFDDGEASGISDASRLMNNEKVNNEVYDLQGRRVKKPMEKGLYIKNGRLIIDN